MIHLGSSSTVGIFSSHQILTYFLTHCERASKDWHLGKWAHTDREFAGARGGTVELHGRDDNGRVSQRASQAASDTQPERPRFIPVDHHLPHDLGAAHLTQRCNMTKESCDEEKFVHGEVGTGDSAKQ